MFMIPWWLVELPRNCRFLTFKIFWLMLYFRFDKKVWKWSSTYLKQTKSRDRFSSFPVVSLVNSFISFLFVFIASLDSSISSAMELLQVIVKNVKLNDSEKKNLDSIFHIGYIVTVTKRVLYHKIYIFKYF